MPPKVKAKPKTKPKNAAATRPGDRHDPLKEPVHTRILTAKVEAVEEKLESEGGQGAGRTKTAIVDYAFDEYLAGRLTLPEPVAPEAPPAAPEVPVVEPEPAPEPSVGARRRAKRWDTPVDDTVVCPYTECGHRAEDSNELREHIDLAHA